MWDISLTRPAFGACGRLLKASASARAYCLAHVVYLHDDDDDDSDVDNVDEYACQDGLLW
jgi:hypothetical protein